MTAVEGREQPIEHLPCLVLTHGRDAVNRESLDAILACDPRLQIHIVHNPSVLEDGSFISYARELVAEGRILSVTMFDKNISNNAILLLLLDNPELFDHDYLILTDGDVAPPPDLVVEQIAILSSHPEVMACGLRMDASRWSDALDVKADLLERYNSTRFETEDYVDTGTGLWMSMFRAAELRELLQILMANDIRLTDANLKLLGATVLEKKWVATKKSIGRELNREQPDYYDAKSTSMSGFAEHSPEPAGAGYATWNHDLVSEATEWKKSASRRVVYPPLRPARPRFRGALETDPVVIAMQSGALTHETGYVIRHSSSAARPGLAFVLSSARRQSGIPFLPGARSILFVGPEDPEGPPLYGLDELDFGASLITWTAEQATALLQTFVRFVADGGIIKGLVFHAETIERQLAEGTAPASSHLPPALRRRAEQAAASRSTADGPVLCALVRRMLCTDELIRDFAAQRGWHVRFSGVTPGRYFTHIWLSLSGGQDAVRAGAAGGVLL
jgi:hypothetical protein